MKKKFNDILDSKLVYMDAFAKTLSVMGDSGKWAVAYSGGSDSDTVMWFLRLCGFEPKGVFFNTGIEMDATWKQIEYMKSEGFDVDVIKAKKSIPTTNREYGTPFLSKYVSEMLSRLQRHNFKFREHGDKNFEELWKKYPNAKAALRWWTNDFGYSSRNISWNRGLKEYLIEIDGLDFSVANRCCDYAKKYPVKQWAKKNGIENMLLGIRKSEGGVRTETYKSCIFKSKTTPYKMFFPIFWWTDSEKSLFDEEMGIKHSDAYSLYGLKRTGCAACPFGQRFEDELLALEKHEPKLYNGVSKIFAKSHQAKRDYLEHRKK